MSGYRARDAVVAVEEFPPEELVSGHVQPLSAGQAGAQHSAVGEMQEDLQHQAVRQGWLIQHQAVRQGWLVLHPGILQVPREDRVRDTPGS